MGVCTMGLFNRMSEPVFLKENSDAERQLEQLRALENQLTPEGQELLRLDIKRLEYGIVGEKNIAFELKNSHIPMYVLHDIHLQDGDLNVQIDYLVVTKKFNLVIECKNLYGDIEIKNTGEFVRSMKLGNRWIKEGIYSPITQNQRHLEMMKHFMVSRRKNAVMKFMTERYFEDFNKAVVVLANPKTVLNTRYAKKEVKEKVIRADQLVQYIKDMSNRSKELPNSDEDMRALAQFYLDMHRDTEVDYTAKYEAYRITANTESAAASTSVQGQNSVNVPSEAEQQPKLEESEIFKQLKAYRLKKSREEGIKPYYIYNDKQLKDLITKMPRSKSELTKVSGFGEVKANKYGDDVLRILGEYGSGVY